VGLLDRIRDGTYVPDDEPGARWAPESAATSLAETADRIAAGGDTLIAARDFLDQVGWVPDDVLERLLLVRPAETGSEKADALLAALAEHLAATRGLACPSWTHEPGRFLDRFWFVSSTPGLRAIAISQTPIALKRRGILWPESSLRRV